MTKKNILLFASVLLLGAASLYLNRHIFASDPISIGSRSVPPRGPELRNARNSKVNTVIFLLNRELQLTSVKVFPLSDAQTNKYPHAIWNLTTESNSVPVKSFTYGRAPRGMRPAVQGATPEPLLPGVPYRVVVEAGKLKAQHDFTPVPRTP